MRFRATGTLAAAAAVGVLAVTGCNASSDDDTADSDMSFVLVTPDPIGTNEFFGMSIEGMEEAAEEHNASTNVYESDDPATIAQNMAAAVRESPDIVIGVGFNLADAIAEEAESNPDQEFLFVDACTEEEFDNVACASFREQESSFLVGAEAGLLTESDHVGSVVALDAPQFHRFSEGFAAGAEEVNSDVDVSTLFVGGQNPFNDPARAKEQATTLANDGVDMVYGVAAVSGNPGVFEAAEENDIMAFGVDSNQCPEAPGTIVDNALKRTDVVVADGINRILDGDTGGSLSYGLAEEGIGVVGLLDDEVADSECVIAEHEDVIEELREIQDKIIDGEITIDDPLDS
ncbi:BMP family ABC transporter substrate-binding protein [Spiractinospora alimapuensis]|uniref:BMP family ABC transporter substrate-binding protein n=1 Tax=Spiractinospora alimapuensis TaxID=2820884 RepID=UPI001F3C41A3|nr:BMP family ABC transporter substrate-binding protein [Spiractinospora alimapuensis]QVQ50077.1 BMP family ABC transporter substrate-binding protein [Spiractinospora alimapuensis]